MRTFPTENTYQEYLIKRLRHMIGDNGFVFPMDGSVYQGFPDILILVNGRWAALECKLSGRSRVQPNQEYYVNEINEMAYASFIYPAIEERVLDELQHALCF
jgi:hypothetical protein